MPNHYTQLQIEERALIQTMLESCRLGRLPRIAAQRLCCAK